MKNSNQTTRRTSLLVVLFIVAASAMAQDGGHDPKAEETITTFKEKNEKMNAYFEDAYGYVVFPSIGKGGIVVGGAHGKGTVYEQGELIGAAKMTQVTIGLQWGGQSYSEVLFFKDKATLESFKNSDLEFAGQASAVAITAGASADIFYENSVAVYTLAKGGLMYEAAIGGQKFKYSPTSTISENDKGEKSE